MPKPLQLYGDNRRVEKIKTVSNSVVYSSTAVQGNVGHHVPCGIFLQKKR